MKQLIFAIVIAILAAVFAIQNAGTVTVRLFFWNFSMSLALLIICLLILGISIGLMLMSKTILQKNAELKRLHKQIKTPHSI